MEEFVQRRKSRVSTSQQRAFDRSHSVAAPPARPHLHLSRPCTSRRLACIRTIAIRRGSWSTGRDLQQQGVYPSIGLHDAMLELVSLADADHNFCQVRQPAGLLGHEILIAVSLRHNSSTSTSKNSPEPRFPAASGNVSALQTRLLLRTRRPAPPTPQHFTEYTWQFFPRRPGRLRLHRCGARERTRAVFGPGVINLMSAPGKFSRWPAFWQYPVFMRIIGEVIVVR